MGVVLSTTNYAPLAFVSAIIGFVSFAFTVGTFLRVVWVNLETMSDAPHEVHGYLTNLRQELLEERASIKIMRKEFKKWHRIIRKEGGNSFLGNGSVNVDMDDVTLRTMGDTIKQLIRRFKAIEQPFLEPGEQGIDAWKDHKHKRRNSSVSPYREHGAPISTEKRRTRSRNDQERARQERDEEEQDDDTYWAQKTQYASFTFRKRLIWLRKKAAAQSLFDTLSRVQIRRIARQVSGLSLLMHELGTATLSVEDTLRRIDERTGSIVGMRRVD